jgi:hypothetical protein
VYILVKTITDRKIPEGIEGKNLAKLARECFLNKQSLSFDFKDIQTVTPEFCLELFFPLITEFGSEFLNQWMKIENILPEVKKIIHSAFNKLDSYFDSLEQIQNQKCDQEVFSLNYFWLIKARELCRDNTTFAEFVLGITDNELCEAISRLSIEEIQHIAQAGWLCFAPRFTSNYFQNLNSKQQAIIDVLLALSATC